MLEVGQELQQGRYRIKEQLSQGGMGTVYLATDRNLGNWVVALKENADTSPETQEQFRREAAVLARLTHANLPRVTDYFIEPSGRQYLVMDYVAGEDLKQIMHKQGGPITESEALTWLEPVMDALAYMHGWINTETGQPSPIVHRDIKPPNIRRTPNGRTVLVDFGLAKYQTEDGTLTGARAVSPGYSPLEQYAGGTDTRSDIYALGATLYTLLTGERPPEAPAIAGRTQIIPPHKLNPQISRQTERVILRAMQIHTVDRYQSIQEMHAALYGTSTFPTGLARHRSSIYRSHRSAATDPVMRRRRSSLSLWIILALLALLTMIGIALNLPATTWNRLAMIANLVPTATPFTAIVPTNRQSTAPTQAAETPVATEREPANATLLTETQTITTASVAQGLLTTATPTLTLQPSPTPSVTNLPTPTVTLPVVHAANAAPLTTGITNTLAFTPTPSATPSPTATPSATHSPAPTATNTAAPTHTATFTATATNTPAPSNTPTATAVPSDTPLPTATATPPPSPTPTASLTPLPSATPTTPPPTATPIPSTPAPGDTWINPLDGAVYVYIPAGEYQIGSTTGNPDEQPVHPVQLNGFWIMQTEVTNGQYARCVAAGACTPPEEERWNLPEFANHPVVNVEWEDARQYAEWTDGRLPSEAEWEAAARGDDARTYPWGETAPTRDLLNFDYVYGDIQPVGTHLAGASPYGVLDMAGNVEEWVADWYSNEYYSASPTQNPTGPEDGVLRVLRGGSFKSNRADVRTTVRGRTLPNARYPNVGFRVARSDQ